jgi:site-specific DNA-methyltransferase (adenine-specific)
MPHFFDVIGKSKFHFVKLLVWDKQTKICGKYYMGQIEFIFLIRKGKDKPINNCGTSDLLSFPNVKDKNADGSNIHDSQKPIGLMQTLIQNSSNVGDIVLEPFAGSGTICIAALRENRKYIGIELDQHYYEVAKKRIETELSQLKLF